VRLRVTEVITSLWPQCHVVPYGSTITRCALPCSDIDLAVVSGYEGEHPWFELSSRLVQAGVCDADVMHVISTSRVPVIKLREGRFNICVDISFGVDPQPTLSLMDEWDKDMPHLRPLVMIVKCLLSQRGLNDVYAGGIGSFTVVVMVRHFLSTLKDTKPVPTTAQGDKENTKGSKKKKLNPSSPLGPLLLQVSLWIHFYNQRCQLTRFTVFVLFLQVPIWIACHLGGWDDYVKAIGNFGTGTIGSLGIGGLEPVD
jgi:DNA polymerase sigma